MSSTSISLEQFYSRLCELYHRPAPAELRVPYSEEWAIAEVLRRPDAGAEFREILEYRERLPAAEKRYFPQSLMRLLSSWQDVLDKARMYEPHPRDVSKVSSMVSALARKEAQEP